MNILITGGAGFIGSHTADALIAKGHRVRILDNLQPAVHPKGKPAYLHPEAEFIQGDVCDRDVLRKVLEGMDAVYHFAAYQDYLPDFSTFFRVNTVSTALIYEILLETGMCSRIQKVVVAASQAVMGEGRYRCLSCAVDIFPSIRLDAQLSQGKWDHSCPVCGNVLDWMPSDESVIHPCNPYAISKNSQEQIAIHLGARYGIPSVAMRYSIVQGPRQSFYNAYSGAMRIFSLSLMLGKQPIIFEDGKQIRDFVNIRDVVSANLLVLESSRSDYQVFNVGGNQAWTVLDFYDTMQRIVNRENPYVMSGYYRYGDTRHIFSDTHKLQALGWKPVYRVEDSIRDYWAYLLLQDNKGDILEYAEKHMKGLQVIRKSMSI
ncbi:MAG: NAD-dependent epimerase/dehydratase family protein [Deltaproteobacteria bacterium]|nr:NAD-dependent epimerase/dehydratase family protein [Deltaproteobacteria bacterium]